MKNTRIVVDRDWGVDSEVVLGEKRFDGEMPIEGVTLGMASSTSRARIFNMALKLAAIHWSDPSIDMIEEMIDNRLLELATGKIYSVKLERKNGKGGLDTQIKAKSEASAFELTQRAYKDATILSVTEYVAKDNK